LVNNAGWTARVAHDDLTGLTDEIFRRTFEVNVLGTWSVTKAAIPHLRASEDPNIITITSVTGIDPVGSSIAYAMSKPALNQMTALLVKSQAPIRVNAIAPGLVVTPWTSDMHDMHAVVKEKTPLHRSATTDEVAEAVVALLRNRHVTGSVFLVDGGFTQVVCERSLGGRGQWSRSRSLAIAVVCILSVPAWIWRNLRVSRELLDVELGHVAVATEHLDGVERHLGCCVHGVQLDSGRLGEGQALAVANGLEVPEQHIHHVHSSDLHPSELRLD